MATTMLLDTATWDLTVDGNGNIGSVSGDYQLAQDGASQCRLFEGELWYDTSQGVPYFQSILGQLPPLPLLKSYFVTAGELVPGVASAQVFIASIDVNRVLTAQLQLTNTSGAVVAVNFVSGGLYVTPGMVQVGGFPPVVLTSQSTPGALPPAPPPGPFILGQTPLGQGLLG
jgi:hypothetical protein